MKTFKGMANGVCLVFAAFAAIAMAPWACGSKVVVEASGTATVRHVVTIEFGVCDSLPEPEAKMECVKSLLQILEEALAKDTGVN